MDVRDEHVIVEIEGARCLVMNWPLSSWPHDYPDQPTLDQGTSYVARRNGDWKILTCQKDDPGNGWVIPIEPAYVFDRNEVHALIDIL